MKARGWTRHGFLVTLLALAALVAGCGGAAQAGPTGEVVLDREDMGGRVVLQEGQTLVITLEANPSTGYRWDLVDAEGQVVAQAGEPEFQSGTEGQGNAVGASGIQILRLEAKDTGMTTLALVYHRPWETDVEPLETLTVEVEVH